MNPLREHELLINRRHFFGRTAAGLGAAALGSLLNPNQFSAFGAEPDTAQTILGEPHFAPKAKRIIYLFMAGGPAQMDLLDYKTTSRRWKSCIRPNCPIRSAWDSGSPA